MSFFALLAAASALVATTSRPIDAPGPHAPLKGTFVRGARPGPMLLVIPGEDSARATGSPAGAVAATTGVIEAARTPADLPEGAASVTRSESVTPCDALVTQGVVTARADHATAERVLRSAVGCMLT